MSALRRQFLADKSKPFTFRPPKNNRLLIRLTKRLLPLIMRRSRKVVEVEVSEEDLERLRELEGQRVILTPNHSAGTEPLILFHLSKLLDQEFNYLAAKEVFEHPFPWGWLMQRLGVYSIVRGTVDRDCCRATCQLLKEGKRWLVIFPEGDICWQNDTVMPFQQGVAQFGFWTCADLVKQGELPPLYFVPIAIKYVYLRDMRPEIERSLKRLENKLLSKVSKSASPSPSQPLTRYARLRRIGEAVVIANEKKFSVRPPQDADLNDRIQHVREVILSRVEEVLGVFTRPEQPMLWRIRDLFNAFDRINYGESEGPEYERELYEDRQQEAQTFYDDLVRVLHFVAIYDGYVRETMTAERFLDVLGRIEVEVFKKRRVWGPRKAVMKIGKPLNLGDYFPHYQTDKRGALQQVTTSLESSVQQMLDEMSHLTMAIESLG
ncbi:MAG: 1-acyl-sn-glycerol-3-phosphate acyltransferase [Candidatus Bipolaricaulia bacterium]